MSTAISLQPSNPLDNDIWRRCHSKKLTNQLVTELVSITFNLPSSRRIPSAWVRKHGRGFSLYSQHKRFFFIDHVFAFYSPDASAMEKCYGCVYLPGCIVEDNGVLNGQYSLALRPTVPRTPGDSLKKSNVFILHFIDRTEMQLFVREVIRAGAVMSDRHPVRLPSALASGIGTSSVTSEASTPVESVGLVPRESSPVESVGLVPRESAANSPVESVGLVPRESSPVESVGLVPRESAANSPVESVGLVPRESAANSPSIPESPPVAAAATSDVAPAPAVIPVDAPIDSPAADHTTLFPPISPSQDVSVEATATHSTPPGAVTLSDSPTRHSDPFPIAPAGADYTTDQPVAALFSQSTDRRLSTVPRPSPTYGAARGFGEVSSTTSSHFRLLNVGSFPRSRSQSGNGAFQPISTSALPQVIKLDQSVDLPARQIDRSRTGSTYSMVSHSPSVGLGMPDSARYDGSVSPAPLPFCPPAASAPARCSSRTLAVHHPTSQVLSS